MALRKKQVALYTITDDKMVHMKDMYVQEPATVVVCCYVAIYFCTYSLLSAALDFSSAVEKRVLETLQSIPYCFMEHVWCCLWPLSS